MGRNIKRKGGIDMLNVENGIVAIHNIDADHEKFVVARLIDGQLWYYGSWIEQKDAKKIADKFENGIVVEVP